MLVLALKVGDTIVINNGEIIVKLLEARGRILRVGVEAPSQIPVHRGEIQDRIEAGIPFKRTRASGAELGDSPAAPCVPIPKERN